MTASDGATYVYDALGQRVEKTSGGVSAETIYFNGQALARLNPATGAWTDLVWANGAMVAEIPGTETGLPVIRLLDHLGSLAATTSSTGAVTGTNVFLPYGQTVSSTTSDVFQFTGLEQDTENGSQHAQHRNLSTAQGRWLRPDPYKGSYDLTNPQSLNRYTYVGNNPLASTDPTGLYLVAASPDLPIGIGGGGGGGCDSVSSGNSGSDDGGDDGDDGGDDGDDGDDGGKFRLHIFSSYRYANHFHLNRGIIHSNGTGNKQAGAASSVTGASCGYWCQIQNVIINNYMGGYQKIYMLII